MKLTLPVMSTFLNLAGEDIVKINVGGAIYEAPFGIFENLPHTRLGQLHLAVSMDEIKRLCDGYNDEEKEFFFDHTCPYFRGILGCYYNEKLHLEETTCVFDFKQTLSYWGLSESNMDSYCGHRCAEKKFQAMRDIKNHNKVVGKFEQEDFGACDWGEFRQRVWVIMERPNYTRKGQVYQIIMLTITCISLLTLIDAILPTKPINVTIFKCIDAVTVFIFTLDYGLRFCITVDKRKFLGSILNFVDLLCIAPYLLVATIIRLTNHLITFNGVLRSQPVYFTLRVFRILRIGRFSYNLQHLIQTLKRSSRQLISLLLLSAIATIFFAGIVYYAERDEQETRFTSIPESMWWSIVTITSVGYGDYTPTTLGGRFIGVLCIFFSLVFVGLPISIVTQSFTQTHSDELLKDIVQSEVITYNISKKHRRFHCTAMRCCIEYYLQLVEDHLLLNEMELMDEQTKSRLWDDETESNAEIIPPTTLLVHRPSELPHSFPRRITLNVGGTKFEILRYSMKFAPDSRLALIYEAISPRHVLKYCDGYNEHTGEIMFYRSPKFFDSIMRFYQTGKLHLTHCCVVGFREELDYWGIEEMTLEPCCRMKYFFHKYEMQQCHEQKHVVRDRIARQNKLWTRKRYIIWAILESPQHHWAGLLYTFLYTMVILLDTTVIILNSLPVFQEGHPIETGHPQLTAIEHACVNLFIADFSIRFCAAPSSHKFFSSKLNVIELTAIIPSLILMIMQQSYIPVQGSFTSKFMFLLQALRVTRVFKIARYSSSLRSLTHTLFSGLRDIFVLTIILFMTVIFFSNLMFYAEQSENFSKEMTFPDALWWAIVTMTTVGYGDIVPNTSIGKLVGAICVLASLVLISVPVSLIIVNFTRHYILTNQKRKVIKLEILQEDIENKNRMSRFSRRRETLRRITYLGYKGLYNKIQETITRKRKSSKQKKLYRKGGGGPVKTRTMVMQESDDDISKSHDSQDFGNPSKRIKQKNSTPEHLAETNSDFVGDTRQLETRKLTSGVVRVSRDELEKQGRLLPDQKLRYREVEDESPVRKEAILSFHKSSTLHSSAGDLYAKAALSLQDSSNKNCNSGIKFRREEEAQRLSDNSRLTYCESSPDYRSRYIRNLKEHTFAANRLRYFQNPIFSFHPDDYNTERANSRKCHTNISISPQ